LRLYELFSLAGFPIGIVNYLTGSAGETGAQLAAHSDIDGLLFAGTRTAGLKVHQSFSRRFPKPCVMEMGGNNPAIVMPSADLDHAVEGILNSAFAGAGQSSTSCSRLYLHQQISEDFLERLVDRMDGCKVGPPEDPDTFMGPLLNDQARTLFQQAVRMGKRDGRLLHGGRSLKKGPLAHGYFVEPTLFDRVRKESPLFREELLVPVLAATEVRSLDEALTLSNASSFGLSAGIFTQVEAEQEQFFEQIEAGIALCNHRDGATSGTQTAVPSFGGWKASSTTGRNLLGPYYITQFMREQTRSVCW
jgi:1-pyrroline-5-carboxylate dehydrogenase